LDSLKTDEAFNLRLVKEINRLQFRFVYSVFNPNMAFVAIGVLIKMLELKKCSEKWSAVPIVFLAAVCQL